MKVKVKLLSHVRLSATPWTVAYQAPPSMGFSRQEYWSGLPFPSPGDLPDPGIKPGSPALEADALTSETPGKPHQLYSINYIGIQLILPLVFHEWENEKPLKITKSVFPDFRCLTYQIDTSLRLHDSPVKCQKLQLCD